MNKRTSVHRSQTPHPWLLPFPFLGPYLAFGSANTLYRALKHHTLIGNCGQSAYPGSVA